MGWEALVLWECELRETKLLTDRIVRFLDSEGSGFGAI
jgi:G:T-mismatch repair DNA endonuclease (very short patch repair protein)